MTAAPYEAIWSTRSAAATFTLGEALGRSLIGGLTIGLVGPLGAGKTQLVKGIAAGNALDDIDKVTSPTFTLVHEYPGRLCLHHVDAYRLRGAAELLALGVDELIRPDSVAAVEWADRVRSALPDDVLWIDLLPADETSRTLTFTASGTLADRFLELFRASYR